VVVPVPVVLGVPVSVVGVVDVVAVLHGGVATVGSVLMGVPAVRDMLAGLALVPVAGVRLVEMAVVRVVDVIAVRDLGMPAGRSVFVLMRGVFLVGSRHGAHL
jgi:hypothetical protein